MDEVRVWSSALSAQQVIDASNGNFDTKNQIMYLDFSQPLNETLPVNQTTTNATSAVNETATNATSAVNETATNATSAVNETATNATAPLGNNETIFSKIKPEAKNETGITNETLIENQTSTSKFIEKNNIPNAFDQSVSVDQNSRIDITLVADDKDNDKLQFDITADPAHGSLDNFNKEKGTVTYTPEKDYSGDDKLSFRALDPNGGQSDPANVNIKINAASQLNETQNTDTGAAKTENLINETTSKQTAETNSAQESNKPPKADAGDDQKAKVNTDVKLDGGKSSD
ncbi:MAG TPA: Ig-like domain-containing protein, partial [Nitrososphaeraceae archaeon]|nr:Ig-like domain-containing protein [Nitrososphaeraceae archaeon]